MLLSTLAHCIIQSNIQVTPTITFTLYKAEVISCQVCVKILIDRSRKSERLYSIQSSLVFGFLWYHVIVRRRASHESTGEYD